jgi:GDP-4-dehydro-6-deoxy-D-mannose reductase
MRSLVTGVDGFIGSHLAEALAAAGDQVFGLSRAPAAARAGDAVVRIAGDMTDAGKLAGAVAQAAPDRVFHLAALNNIAASFADPALTMATNVAGSAHLLEAVRKTSPGAAFVSVGSSAEYGLTAATAPVLTEELPLLPTSPYGVSKVAQGLLVRVYAQVYGLRAVHVRPFAVIGPRKTKDAISDFCRNVVALERGTTDRFIVGPLTSERDFVDVRDAVAALVTLSERGAAGTAYNLCNGRNVVLADAVAALQRLSARPFQPTADPSRLRPADDVRIVGDGSRLRALGYAPRFSLEETLAATLAYWRAAP